MIRVNFAEHLSHSTPRVAGKKEEQESKGYLRVFLTVFLLLVAGGAIIWFLRPDAEVPENTTAKTHLASGQAENLDTFPEQDTSYVPKMEDPNSADEIVRDVPKPDKKVVIPPPPMDQMAPSEHLRIVEYFISSLFGITPVGIAFTEVNIYSSGDFYLRGVADSPREFDVLRQKLDTKSQRLKLLSAQAMGIAGNAREFSLNGKLKKQGQLQRRCPVTNADRDEVLAHTRKLALQSGLSESSFGVGGVKVTGRCRARLYRGEFQGSYKAAMNFIGQLKTAANGIAVARVVLRAQPNGQLRALFDFILYREL